MYVYTLYNIVYYILDTQIQNESLSNKSITYITEFVFSILRKCIFYKSAKPTDNKFIPY